MALVKGFDVNGSPATLAGVTGKAHTVTRVIGQFTGTGPQTGTLRLKEGATTIWEASVSGGLDVSFSAAFTLAAGASATLELTGGSVRLFGYTPV